MFQYLNRSALVILVLAAIVVSGLRPYPPICSTVNCRPGAAPAAAGVAAAALQPYQSGRCTKPCGPG